MAQIPVHLELCLSCSHTTCLRQNCRAPTCEMECFKKVVEGQANYVICQSCIAALNRGWLTRMERV